MIYWSKNHLNEAASSYDATTGNEDIIEKLGEIEIFDEKTKSMVKKKTSEFIKVCNDATYKMMRDYPYLYQFMAKCKVMYLPVWPSDITDTMCVDSYNNLWINFHFVYNTCKMDSNRVFGILFHEMFHVFFDHLLRFNERYPADMFAGGLEGARKRANMKANICMDYEVNASMVDDGIVDPNFFKRMDLLYKKEYTGMTWEEIMDKVGDAEYKEWLTNNGFSLDDLELKILDAIEKASKVLMDPSADEDEKKYARRELQDTLDKLLGKEDKGEKSIKDELEELSNSKLGDVADLKMDMDDVIDDLYKNPAGMSDEEFEKTMKDIDKMTDNMMEHAEEIGQQFGKEADEVSEDVTKAKESLKKAIEKMKEGGLSAEEKQDLIDKAKDDLEDIISDEAEKDKLAKKREERDAKKAAERLEKFKKNHPIRSLINVLKNLAGLEAYSVVADKTVELANKAVDSLEPLTEKHFKDMTEDDWKEPKKIFEDLKESFFHDLVALIDNETILNKTEDDMHRLLDGVFDFVFKSFDTALNNELDEDARGSVIKTAAQKMRIIGKVLKTQKVWKVGDDFKEAYMAEMKRLLKIQKEGGDEALFKELLDKGVIEPMNLDENGLSIYTKLTGKGRFDDLKDKITGASAYEDEDEDEEWTLDRIKEDLADRLRKTGMSEEEISDFENAWDEQAEKLGDEEPEEKIDVYDGSLYYCVSEDDFSGVVVELSDKPDYLEDHDYEKFGKKFKKDFPEYRIWEVQESIFEVYYKGSKEQPSVIELKRKIKEHPDYIPGNWDW